MVVDVNYWTKVLKKILITAFTILLVYLGCKLAIFYMPFLIAFIISLLLEPGIKHLMKKWNFSRKKSAIIMLVIVILIIVAILAFSVSSLISESSNFLNNINGYVSMATNQIENVKDNFKNVNIPESVMNKINDSSQDLINTASDIIQKTIKSSVNFVSSVPQMGLYFMITVLALYFLCTDKVYMVDQMEHHLPETWVKKIYNHSKDLTKSMGGYLKAEIILIFISFVISLVGLYIFHFAGLNVKYPLLYALGIGFVDALPIFGSGAVMVPWAIISACYGDIKLALSIFLLWGIMSIVRQFLEPKIVGNHIGIHPIFTLIAMYTGYKITGVLGLFIGPIILIILKNVFGTMIDNGFIKTIFSREVE